VPSERVQRQIDRLLDAIEAAQERDEWTSVGELARRILDLDPTSEDAAAFVAAADRREQRLGDRAAVRSGPVTQRSAAPQPTSFASGGDVVERRLPESSFAAVINHIGLTTADIFGTIDWYCSVLGFHLIMGPRVLDPSGASAETRQIYGDHFSMAYQAHLVDANGVGLEVFQFVEPAVEPSEPEMRYTRPGFFHVCLSVSNVGEAIERIVAAGGTKLSDEAEFVPGRPWRNSYCRDPWGNAIELISASYTEVFADWPQPGMKKPTRLLERDGSEYVIAPSPT
jgi:catechol 2,3-dioxygenase-like lactoylglutathione lyase family enzyme